MSFCGCETKEAYSSVQITRAHTHTNTCPAVGGGVREGCFLAAEDQRRDSCFRLNLSVSPCCILCLPPEWHLALSRGLASSRQPNHLLSKSVNLRTEFWHYYGQNTWEYWCKFPPGAGWHHSYSITITDHVTVMNVFNTQTWQQNDTSMAWKVQLCVSLL